MNKRKRDRSRAKLRRALATSTDWVGGLGNSMVTDPIVFGQRDSADHVFRRAATLTPNSLDSGARRVRSVLTTEDPAGVYDFRRGQVVLEVLLVSGAQYESQTPLIRDHRQYDSLAVCGSVTDTTAERDELLGWLSFGRDLDEESEAIWRRVDQGHLRRVSIGYTYGDGDYVTIPAGRSQKVGSRNFTAPAERDLRVVTRWWLREVSLVVVPADPRAQMRDAQAADPSRGTVPDGGQTLDLPTAPTSITRDSGEDESAMKKYLRFLHKHGLATSVTNETEALRWASDGNLTDAQLNEFAKLCAEDNISFVVAQAKTKSESPTPAPGTSAGGGGNPGGAGPVSGSEPGEGSGTRSHQPQTGNPGPGGNATNPGPGPDPVQAGITAERNRVAAIRELHRAHPDVPQDVVDRLESDGSSLEHAREAFLTAMRGREPGAPAVHARGSQQITRHVLQAALLERAGIRADSEFLDSDVVRSASREENLDIGWLCNQRTDEGRDTRERNYDLAHQRGLDSIHTMQLCRAIAELETNERYYDDEQVLQRAFSNGGFTAVYGAVQHMALLASYAITEATYQRFCEVRDVSDLRKHTEAEMTGIGRLKKQGKNPGKAATLNVDDPVLSAIIASRYAGKLQVTDQMVINDFYGVIGQLPAELGKTCRHMINDLAFAQVLRTDNLDDGSPRYDAALGNSMDHAAIDEDMWDKAGTMLLAKKQGNRRINLEQGAVLAGVGKSPKVRKWMSSQTIAEADNPHRGTYDVITDTAVDLGVMDPQDDDLEIAGTPNNLYLFTGSDTRRSITVAFRRGTNRGPVVRNYMLTQGEWGIGWDVFMDMGAAFRRRLGTARIRITG